MRSGGGDGGESALPNDGGDKPDVSVKNAEGEVRPAAEDGRGRGAVQLLPKGAQEESSAGLPPRGQGQLGDRDQLVEVPAEGKGKGEGLKASPPASYHQRGRSLGDAQPHGPECGHSSDGVCSFLVVGLVYVVCAVVFAYQPRGCASPHGPECGRSSEGACSFDVLGLVFVACAVVFAYQRARGLGDWQATTDLSPLFACADVPLRVCAHLISWVLLCGSCGRLCLSECKKVRPCASQGQ